jgi:hypothetical protein
VGRSPWKTSLTGCSLLAIVLAIVVAGSLAACGGGPASAVSSGADTHSSAPTASAGDGSAGDGSAGDGSASHAPVSHATASHTPAGFWYGTDSWPVPISGSAPYQTASIGGAYGGYIGMTGNWARWQGCGTGNFLAWSGVNAAQANANYTRYGVGIGTAVYWYMGGPGVDPHWTGGTAEAAAWGAEQAAQAIADAGNDHVTYPVLFMDIEMPGIEPAVDNGWQDVYSSACGGVVRPGQHVTSVLARAEFNGFADYLTAHSRYRAGVYSDPVTWQQIFGLGTAGRIPRVYEWTYEPETAELGAAPHGWCLNGVSGCAQFFGGVSTASPYAVMWQWSGGGGVRNPVGDFDQIDDR